MEEEVQLYLDETTDRMKKAIAHLEQELSRIRAGKANPSILEGVKVDYYGVDTPLNQVSNINTPDAKTIMIQPWEKNLLEPIERAIMAANLGYNPINNGEVLRINIPALTEERRGQIVKQVKSEGENAKVSIRNTRKWANDEFKQLQKDGLSEDAEKAAEDEVQKLTDEYTQKVEELVEAKEKDIMTV
jgi:ribosome recycling factor